MAQVMPRSVWETLSPRAREVTRFMIPDEGEPPLETGPVPNGETHACTAAAAVAAARLEEALEDLVNSRTRLCIFLLVLTLLPVGAAHVKRAAKSRGQGRRIRDSASH